MKRIESEGYIKNGVLKIKFGDIFKEAISQLPDGDYRILIERNYRKRSNQQNRYLNGVVYPLVLRGLWDLGWSKYDFQNRNEIHDYLRSMFLQIEYVNEQTGEIIKKLGSTAVLNTVDFSEYVEKIRQWADEYLNIYIPLPGEQTEITFKP